jgi:hypothetical protein
MRSSLDTAGMKVSSELMQRLKMALIQGANCRFLILAILPAFN